MWCTDRTQVLQEGLGLLSEMNSVWTCLQMKGPTYCFSLFSLNIIQVNMNTESICGHM